MKVSVVIPVYNNEDTLIPLYEDIRENFIEKVSYEYELVFVDDGSEDRSREILKSFSEQDKNIRIIKLSRNFGSHAALLCGLEHSTGDCAVIKTADLQEPTELLHRMADSWKQGNNVVLALREKRNEGRMQIAFADFYYWLVRKLALKKMPEHGFDVFLIDRKVIEVLSRLDEKNSAITAQILWSGFKTDSIGYIREARKTGKGKWTLQKKVRLVTDTVFSFSNAPVTAISVTGILAILVSLIWAAAVGIGKISGKTIAAEWTPFCILLILCFGILMLSLGALGEYLWRTLDAARKRPPYIIEKEENSVCRRGEDAKDR